MGQEQAVAQPNYEDGTLTIVNAQISKISKESLRSLPAIMAMNLTNNRIRRLPRDLKDLKYIILAKNGLREISDDMKRSLLSYTQLESIDLSANRLQEIPQEICEIPTLRNLVLFRNRIKSFTGGNASYRHLNIGCNCVAIMPKFNSTLAVLIMDMNNVTVVDSDSAVSRLLLSGNALTEIRGDLVFKNVGFLDISYNNLTKLPDMSNVCPAVKKFNASHNLLTEFPKLPSGVDEVDLSHNKISCVGDLQALPYLEHLDISHNNIELVPVLPSLLMDVDVSGNRISQIDESEVGKLKRAAFANNMLEAVPVLRECAVNEYNLMNNCISQFSVSDFVLGVTRIDLSGNDISEIPEAVFDQLPKLLHLNLSRNKIKSLPPCYTKSCLRSLNLSCNPLSELPDEAPGDLEVLRVAYCNLRSIPESFADSEELIELDASGNELTSIPFISSLRSVNLSRNKFTQLPKLPDLISVIDVSFNEITDLPECLSFPELSELDVSHNNLTKFPLTWDTPRLYCFRLSHNKVSLPLDLSVYQCLTVLDISDTRVNLIEPIPSTVSVFTTNAAIPTARNIKFRELSDTYAFAEHRIAREISHDRFMVKAINPTTQLFTICGVQAGTKSARLALGILSEMLDQNPFAFETSYFAGYVSQVADTLRTRPFTGDMFLAIACISGNRMITVSSGNASVLVVSKDGQTTATTPKSAFPQFDIRETPLDATARYVVVASPTLARTLRPRDISALAARATTPTDLASILCATASVTSGPANFSTIVLEHTYI